MLRVLAILAALCTLAVGLLAFAIYRTITVGGDLRAARNVVLKELNVRYASKLEVSAHPLLVGLARFGVGLAPIDREARLALKAVRGAEVGVYQLTSNLDAEQRTTLFHKVDQRMEKRGWNRTVAVMDGDDMVLVYTPAGEMDLDELEAFVFVLNGRELVLVAGMGNLEPVRDLIDDKVREHLPEALGKHWLN